jgi:hypothetical protein
VGPPERAVGWMGCIAPPWHQPCNRFRARSVATRWAVGRGFLASQPCNPSDLSPRPDRTTAHQGSPTAHGQLVPRPVGWYRAGGAATAKVAGVGAWPDRPTDRFHRLVTGASPPPAGPACPKGGPAGLPPVRMTAPPRRSRGLGAKGMVESAVVSLRGEKDRAALQISCAQGSETLEPAPGVGRGRCAGMFEPFGCHR